MKRISVIILVILLFFGITSIGLAEGTRDNLYLIEDSFILEGRDIVDGYMKFEFELIEVKIGERAYHFLIEQDGKNSADIRLNKAKEENKGILLIKVSAQVLELEREPLSLNLARRCFEIIDSDGKAFPVETNRDTNEPFNRGELLQGDKVSGWLTFLIPNEGELSLLISLIDDTAYIDLKLELERKNAEDYKELSKDVEVEEESYDVEVEEERPEDDPINMMKTAFIGNYEYNEIKDRIDEALSLYGEEITHENYHRAGSVLVALRKEYGPAEMRILNEMIFIKSSSPDLNITFPEGAAVAVNALSN